MKSLLKTVGKVPHLSFQPLIIFFFLFNFSLGLLDLIHLIYFPQQIYPNEIHFTSMRTENHRSHELLMVNLYLPGRSFRLSISSYTLITEVGFHNIFHSNIFVYQRIYLFSHCYLSEIRLTTHLKLYTN